VLLCEEGKQIGWIRSAHPMFAVAVEIRVIFTASSFGFSAPTRHACWCTHSHPLATARPDAWDQSANF
jgi:hypothetical protein